MDEMTMGELIRPGAPAHSPDSLLTLSKEDGSRTTAAPVPKIKKQD